MELDTVKAILSVMLMNYGGCCSINNLKFDYRKYLGGNSEVEKQIIILNSLVILSSFFHCFRSLV